MSDAFLYECTTLDPWFQKKWEEGDYTMGVDVGDSGDDYSVVIFIHHIEETYWEWRSVELELLEVLLVDNSIWNNFW